MNKIVDWINAARDRWRARHPLSAEFVHQIAGTAIMGVVSFVFFMVIYLSTSRPERLPYVAAYVFSYIAMLGLPVLMVLRHRWRQQRRVARARALYAEAVEWLMQGDAKQAALALQPIRRVESAWRMGNGRLYRLAYGLVIALVTAAAWAAHLFMSTNVASDTGYGMTPHKSLTDTTEYLLARPLALWFMGGFAFFAGLSSLSHLRELAEERWGEFYGDLLDRALRAGRSVNAAPWHEGAPLPGGATARELLGLPQSFTAADLRKAWLRLVRELHPDRWAVAGKGVRDMKEAALKRINAARDELATQAVG